MGEWIMELPETSPVAYAMLLLSTVCVAGMGIGSFRIKGIGLGSAGVLFAGIAVGHFTMPVEKEMLEFVKEMGLTLFVYTMGLQLGPGILASLRDDGLRLNAIAAFIVIGGAAVAAGVGIWMQMEPASIPGLFSGATTNTPSLGAVQQTIAQLPTLDDRQQEMPALAYAVAYPMAIAGIIGTLLLLRFVFKFDPEKEAEEAVARQEISVPKIERRTIQITNEAIDGKRIGELRELLETGVVLSRVSSTLGGKLQPATARTLLSLGDLVLAVGTKEALDRAQPLLGKFSAEDLVHTGGAVIYRRALVTHPDMLGKTVEETGVEERFGVVVSRITRADIEVTAVKGLKLQFGDMLRLVGEEESIAGASKFVGNSLKKLNTTNFVPFFLGLALGVALGMLPIPIPGMPQPLKLGLAGGPLLVAIVLSRLGRIGRLICHMPTNANLAFREFGISLFFAAVGLKAGGVFFESAFSEEGLTWLVGGLLVTLVPLLAAGFFAMGVLKMKYPSVAGLLAGSMTDPPALAFANNAAQSDAPNVSYATVYPLTTLLRIVSAQFLVLWLLS